MAAQTMTLKEALGHFPKLANQLVQVTLYEQGLSWDNQKEVALQFIGDGNYRTTRLMGKNVVRCECGRWFNREDFAAQVDHIYASHGANDDDTAKFKAGMLIS